MERFTADSGSDEKHGEPAAPGPGTLDAPQSGEAFAQGPERLQAGSEEQKEKQNDSCQGDAISTLLAQYPTKAGPMHLTAMQRKTILANRSAAVAKAAAKAASTKAATKAEAAAVRTKENKAAALAKQKAKKDKAEAAAAATPTAAAAKRSHSMAFDDSQQHTQDEPPPSPTQSAPKDAPKKPKHNDIEKEGGNNKRKNPTEEFKKINEEVRTTKAAKKKEYEAQLKQRTAGPPTKAAAWTRSEASTNTSGTGYERIHSSHKRCRLNGEVIFCWVCGYWMIQKSQKLSEVCDSGNMTANQRSVRDYKLRKCLHPTPSKVAKWKDGTCITKQVPIERLDPS
jgi:hypothetical protein